MLLMRGLTMLVLLMMPGAAYAQARQCEPPRRIAPPRPDGPTASQPRRLLPTGGYTLALTWSPQHCRTRLASDGHAFQCGGGGEPRFGFTLHGLWPDGRGPDWPQYCRPAQVLPAATLRRNLCATPSAQLLQHEWAKHGTCMTRDPDAYFDRARRLYEGLVFPDMAALSRRPLTVGSFAAAFAAANPGTPATALRVRADRQGWLDELWICLDLRFRPQRCPTREAGPAPTTRLRIWRGAR